MDGVRLEDIEIDKNAANRLAQKLSSTNGCIRRRTMKKLRRLLERSAGGNEGLLNEINLLRLWKGLHYCMWIADDPQFQEELAENMASLVSCFTVTEHSLLFVDAFLKVETQEWPLLDFHRLDKFMMLARKMLKSAFQHLQCHATEPLCKQFVHILEKSVFAVETSSTHSFIMHVRKIITEELRNMKDGQVPTLHVRELVELLQARHQRSSLVQPLPDRYIDTVAENLCQRKRSDDSLENSSVKSSPKSPSKGVKRKLECDDSDFLGKAKMAKISNTVEEDSSQGSSMEIANEEVEINIWVPNKKYNGAMKATAARHFQMAERNCRTVSPKRTKSAALLMTPKSDPTDRGKKRVSFALSQNKSQNYEDSLILTPKLTFDPSRKPAKGVLKLSPGFPERPQKSKFLKKKKNFKHLKGKKFL